MNVTEAKEIFLQALPELSEPFKSAVEFTLANWHKLIADLPHEQWRGIEGYEDIYQIRNLGRVKSLIWNGGRLINP